MFVTYRPIRRPALAALTALSLGWALLAATPTAAQEGTLAKIKADGRITVAAVADLPPFSMLGDDGIYSGLSIELCRAIAMELATLLEIPNVAIDYVDVTLQSRLDAIVSGRADMECGATTITFSRRERVDFSVPFFASGASIAVADTTEQPQLSDLEGKRIAVVAGTTTQNALKRALLGERVSAEIVTVEHSEDALAAIREDRADAIAHDKMILIGLMQGPNGADLVPVPGLLSFEPYGIVLPRGDADFRLAVDRAIIGLYQDGVLDSLYDKWLEPLGAQPGPTLERMLQLQAVPE